MNVLQIALRLQTFLDLRDSNFFCARRLLCNRTSAPKHNVPQVPTDRRNHKGYSQAGGRASVSTPANLHCRSLCVALCEPLCVPLCASVCASVRRCVTYIAAGAGMGSRRTTRGTRLSVSLCVSLCLSVSLCVSLGLSVSLSVFLCLSVCVFLCGCVAYKAPGAGTCRCAAARRGRLRCVLPNLR